jgi:hypothetical protein
MSIPFVTKDSNGSGLRQYQLLESFRQNLQRRSRTLGYQWSLVFLLVSPGSLSSLKSVIPDENKLPGISPFIAVGGNIVADWFPSLAPGINKVLGQSAGRGFWDTVSLTPMSKSIWAAMSPW